MSTVARRGQNEDSIYFDSTRQCWVAAVSLGRDGTGKRRRATRTAKTRTEARQKLKELRGSIDGGLPPGDGRLTVGRFLDRWVESLPSVVAKGTADDYGDTVRLHLKPALGNKVLVKLTVAEVNALWTGKRAEGYSANSVRLMRAVLRRAIANAERQGLVPRNVAGLSDPPRLPKEEGRSLTAEQARLLLGAAASDRLEACFVLTLTFGLRRGETLGISWEDVDLKAGTVLIRRGLERVKVDPLADGTYPGGRKTRLAFTDLKNARSRRRVELTPPLVEVLKRHRERQRLERRDAGASWQDHGLLFTTTIGTPIDPDNFNGMLSRLCQRAGLGHWHPHELRHSGASLMLALGTPLHVVSEILGHSSIVITKDVYGHLVAGERRTASEAMTAALLGPGSESHPESHPERKRADARGQRRSKTLAK